MNSFASVKYETVQDYRVIVARVVEFDMRLNDALLVLETLLQRLISRCNQLEDKCLELEEAGTLIASKIHECEKNCSSLNDEIKRLKDAIGHLQFQLTHEHDADSRYIIKNDISLNREQIKRLKQDLSVYQQRLSHCNLLKQEVRLMIKGVQSRVASLHRSEDRLKDFFESLTDLKQRSLDYSTKAYNSLLRAEEAITEYLSVQTDIKPATNTLATTVLAVGIGEIAYLSTKYREMQENLKKNGNEQHYDDDGKVYRVGNEIVSNSTIDKDGFQFITDSKGRVMTATGKYSLDRAVDSKRDWDATLKEIGKGDEKEGDDRGHIIAHRFGGPDSLINAFPQDMHINRGAYGAFEEYLASELSSCKEIWVSVSLIYEKDSHRPSGVVYMYEIDGEISIRTFPNEQEEE